MQTKEDLKQELKELELANYCLECSDDALFLNANGNLPVYQERQKRINEIYKELEDAVYK